MASERGIVVRRALASLASAALSAFLFARFDPLRRHFEWKDALFMCVVCLPPMGAAVALWSQRLVPQLLARACWWCFLLACAFATATMGPIGGVLWVFLGVCSASALLALGRTGLDAKSGRFQPVAFRGTLLLSLLLALADTGSLSFCAIGTATDGWREAGKVVALAGLALFACFGVVGLLRLRTWGLLAALASNLLVGTLAFTGALPLPPQLRLLFMGTAALQLVVPLPMLVTIVRRRPPPPDRWQRFRAVGSTLVIVGLAAFVVYAELVPGWRPLFRHFD
jgi:hypothetical protein